MTGCGKPITLTWATSIVAPSSATTDHRHTPRKGSMARTPRRTATIKPIDPHDNAPPHATGDGHAKSEKNGITQINHNNPNAHGSRPRRSQTHHGATCIATASPNQPQGIGISARCATTPPSIADGTKNAKTPKLG